MKKVLSILTLIFATAIVASESERDTPLSGRSTAVPTTSCEELSALTQSSFKPLQDKRVLSIANILPEELDEIFNRSPSPANIADPEPELSRKVNFVDYAVLADSWLTEQLWP